MINDTLNGSLLMNNPQPSVPDFNIVSSVMQHPLILTAMALVWFVPIFLYLIVGSIAKGRSSNGQKTSKPMICYPNYWYAMIIWGLIQLALFIFFLVFPLWIKMISA